MAGIEGTHWVIQKEGDTQLYLTERRGEAYGRKKREWKPLHEAAVFPQKGAASRAAGQAKAYAGPYKVISVGLYRSRLDA